MLTITTILYTYFLLVNLKTFFSTLRAPYQPVFESDADSFKKKSPTPVKPALLPGCDLDLAAWFLQCKQGNRTVCGQAAEYPQERMCGTEDVVPNRFFVQFTFSLDSSLVRPLLDHVNP